MTSGRERGGDAALAALTVWVELLIRSAGIYVCVLFFGSATTLKLAPDLATIGR